MKNEKRKTENEKQKMKKARHCIMLIKPKFTSTHSVYTGQKKSGSNNLLLPLFSRIDSILFVATVNSSLLHFKLVTTWLVIGSRTTHAAHGTTETKCTISFVFVFEATSTWR